MNLALQLAEIEKQVSILISENIEYKKQLTRAKEIIKEMLSILPKDNIEGIYEITEQSEQFLKENK